MKAIHITTTDFGGAFRAASNISEAMKRQGTESFVLVREKSGQEEVIPAVNTLWSLFFSKLRNFINLQISCADVVNDRFGYAVHRHPLVRDADVIILHWVNSFVSYRGVEELLRLGKPVVWVMHDMWLFTGGCHYDKECGKYRGECTDCPLAGKYRKDFTRRIQERKRKMLLRGNLTVVGCSRWITNCAKKSRILEHKRCICIPNPVNTDIFKRQGQRRTAERKKTILFGAMILADERKGLDLLTEALSCLPKEQFVLSVVGEAERKIFEKLEFEYHFYGKIDSQERMAEIYNQADVYVIPSRQENLSNAVIEAMACGVPVAAFDIGGMSDMILHQVNGYLAEPFDCKALADGILFCTKHYDKLSVQAETMVLRNFSMEAVGSQYNQLLMEISGK